MTILRRTTCAATFVGMLTATSLAAAADYYFDSIGGDDAKDGSTDATAKKTLKMPTGSGHTVHLKRGSSWTMSLNASNVTVTTYGSGSRPIINGSITVNSATVDGVNAMPTSSNGFNVQSSSTVRDCEVDGTNCTASIVGVGVLGENNKILGNYIHDLNFSQSGSTMNNSGGAEGIMVMASNNEVGFNSVVNAQSVNTTLGGFEGGCYEIVNNKGAGKSISNVSFHHNFCDKSVGLWEGCSGDFSSTGGSVLTNHAIIENVTVSYNVSVDSMWLFLLQPVNTDFKNVVFANNTIIHTPKSAEYWDSGGGHFSMALAVDSDTSTGSTIKADNQYYKQGSGFQPGTIIVKNNLFIDNISSTRQVMFLTNLTDHSNNLFVPSTASVSFAMGSTPALTLGSTEKKVDLSALALTTDYRLTATSAAAIDQGATIDMNASASTASVAVSPAVFQDTFNQDIDRRAVPCGAAIDIGASEYCSGSGGSVGAGGRSTTSTTSSTGGASTTSTTTSTSTGGASTSTSSGGTTASTETSTGGTSGGATSSTTSTTTTAPSGSGGSSGNATTGTGQPGSGGITASTNTTSATGAATASGTPTSETGGCSCKTVGGRNAQGNAMGALGLLALALTRKRRRR